MANSSSSSSSSTGAADQHIFDNPTVRTVMIVSYSIVFVFCFFGNLIVVIVTSYHWRMRNVTKFCLSNLAITNMCVGIFCVFQNLTLFLSNKWIFGSIMCKMYHFINSLSHTASLLILVVISVERYLVILHPLKCRRVLTIHRLRLIILGVWILSALLCSPRLYYMVLLRHPFISNTTSPTYLCVPLTRLYDFKMSDTIQFVLLFILPLLVITSLYTRIGLFLRERDCASFSQNIDFNKAGSNNKHLRNGSGGVRTMSSYDEEDPQILTSVSEGHNPYNVSVEQSQGKGSLGEESRASIKSGRLLFLLKGNVSLEMDSGDKRKRKRRKKKKNNNYPTMIRINFARPGSNNHNGLSSCCDPKPNTGFTSIYRPHKVVVRMLIAVVMTFTLCNLPYHVRKMYQHYAKNPDYKSDISDLLTPLTFLMMYANCAINPFLYAFMSKNFTLCFLELIRCKVRRKPSNGRRHSL